MHNTLGKLGKLMKKKKTKKEMVALSPVLVNSLKDNKKNLKNKIAMDFLSPLKEDHEGRRKEKKTGMGMETEDEYIAFNDDNSVFSPHDLHQSQSGYGNDDNVNLTKSSLFEEVPTLQLRSTLDAVGSTAVGTSFFDFGSSSSIPPNKRKG